MRITGGSLTGRRVTVPPGVIRPAMDRMRESLFSILGPLEGTSFLDLFTGSGVMTLEAISRGATRATLVERDRGKRRVILENLELARDTGCPSPRLIMAPVEVYVSRARETFDTIYLDPPFDYRHKADLLSRVIAANLLDPDGRMVIHYPGEETLPDRFGDTGHGVVCDDERRYGRSTVRFYRREAAGQQ